MDRGKINTVAPPRELIDRLGRFAVDEVSGEKTVSRFFADREAAIRCLQAAGPGAGMRETTLEDVFLERLGRHLEKK
jgi:ABC-2 type transport system ATP-binding protein